MGELNNAESTEVAAFLARVVPHSQEEADRLEQWVRYLARRPLPHGSDLLG